MNPAIFIPARLQSKRLPNKLLLDLLGKPIIQHVWENCCKSDLPVFVVSNDEPILEVIKNNNGNVVKTRKDHASGTDRISEALSIIDPTESYDMIINVQGDLPGITVEAISLLLNLMKNDYPVGTLLSVIHNDSEKININTVKAILAKNHRVLYFSRACLPYGNGPYYQHIGVYAYRRAMLSHFAKLPVSPLEKRERLEQLRIIEDGIPIYADILQEKIPSVDTEEDLQSYQELLCSTARLV